MKNPIVHVLVFAAAVVIPGGLLVYWLWMAKNGRDLKKEKGPKVEKSLPENFETIEYSCTTTEYNCLEVPQE
mgnify:CR=1 FL=1